MGNAQNVEPNTPSINNCAECKASDTDLYYCKYCNVEFCSEHKLNHMIIQECDHCCNNVCVEMSMTKDSAEFREYALQWPNYMNYNVLCLKCFAAINMRYARDRLSKLEKVRAREHET